MTLRSVNAVARTAASLLLLFSPTFAISQQSDAIAASSGAAQISFQFERPGLPVPRFTLTVDDTGKARYESDEVVPTRGGAESDPPPLQHLDRTVTLSKSTIDRIFSNTLALDRFNTACESRAKNIADTGTKTLRYTGSGGEGSCTYNFSENKRVVLLTDLFQGIARTLDMGRKLDFQHRFDRLGLDATMASLVAEVEGGRAMEVGIITPTLQSLVNDSEVLQRVRQRAGRLLQIAQSPS